MKFLSSASTAALAFLLLLMSVALGEPHFLCSYNEKISLEGLKHDKSFCDVARAKSGDPLGPNGEFYRTRRYSLIPNSGYTTAYIVQLIDDTPTFRVYEKKDEGWELCLFREN